MFHTLLDGLGDLLFPYHCILCRKFLEDKSRPQLCSSCLTRVEFNAPPFCLRCSRHLEIYTPEGLCATCLKHPVSFDQAWGVVHYDETIQKLLHLFKYHERTGIRKIFEFMIRDFLVRYKIPLSNFDYIVPMPLHSVRLRERGFNQSRYIAEVISAISGRPIMDNILKRVKPTDPQALLGRKERWTNLKAAFRINRSFNFNNHSILLVDDLLTTGATACAAAETLKNAGTKRIDLFVVALAK